MKPHNGANHTGAPNGFLSGASLISLVCHGLPMWSINWGVGLRQKKGTVLFAFIYNSKSNIYIGLLLFELANTWSWLHKGYSDVSFCQNKIMVSLREKRSLRHRFVWLYMLDYVSGSLVNYEGWSPWSVWSTCDPDCIRHRQRSCNPAAVKTSLNSLDQPCPGPDRDVDVCTGGLCERGKL